MSMTINKDKLDHGDKLKQHRQFMGDLKRVMTVNMAKQEPDFWQSVYATEDFLLKEVLANCRKCGSNFKSNDKRTQICGDCA